MIDKVKGYYVLICDSCGEVAEERFTDFYDAVEHKERLGWKSSLVNSLWDDVCPECQQSEIKDRGKARRR